MNQAQETRLDGPYEFEDLLEKTQSLLDDLHCIEEIASSFAKLGKHATEPQRYMCSALALTGPTLMRDLCSQISAAQQLLTFLKQKT